MDKNRINVIVVLNCPHCHRGHPFIVETETSEYLAATFKPCTPCPCKILFICPETKKELLVAGVLIASSNEKYGAIKPVDVLDYDFKSQEVKDFTDYYQKIDPHNKRLAEQLKKMGAILGTHPGGDSCGKFHILGFFNASCK